MKIYKGREYSTIANCEHCDDNGKERGVEMEIKVYEKGSKQKLIAYVVGGNSDKRELVRTEKGRDDLLNQIEAMNLSHLTVEFM